MKNNLSKIQEKIAKKSKELDLSIENGKDNKVIFQKSMEIDQLIAECIRNK